MLFALIVLPIVAGFALFALPKTDTRACKAIGVAVALATIAMTLAARNSEQSVRWLSRPFTAAFHVGDSGIGFWIALLLTLCTLCAILASNVPRLRTFIAMLLWLEGTMLGVFLARDLVLFALFWDLMLIPVFLTLVNWGEHPATAWRYFLYNFAGGLTLLLATAAYGILAGTTDVIGASGPHVVGGWVPWIFAGFAFAFLVKTPVFPFHTWMPITYRDTPPPMVAVVGAVQSKAGLYGLIVVAMALLPDYLHAYANVFIVLGVISMLYGAFVALVQSDVKRIVAYSSLSHLGLIVVAIATFNAVALQGAVLYIIAHGLFTAAIFLTLGYVEEREETRSLVRLGGLGAKNPRMAGALCIAALAALGLPGLAGFAGELIIISGIFQSGLIWVSIVALIPIVLAAAYMLRLYQGVMNGPEVADLPERRDLTWIEGLAVAPLIAALVAVGVAPAAILSFDTSAYNVTVPALHTAQVESK